MKPIIVKDMTRLFTKELLLYSFFDLTLKKPLRIAQLIYTIVLFLIFSAPLAIFISALNFWNLYTIGFTFGIPIILGNFMAQPIWGGKSFISWFKCLMRYYFSKKHYYDGVARASLPVMKIESMISVSRRSDYVRLIKEIKEEKTMKKLKKRAA